VFFEFFYSIEIRRENPIGMQGNIALSYGHLISKLWGNVRGPLAPFDLRVCLFIYLFFFFCLSKRNSRIFGT